MSMGFGWQNGLRSVAFVAALLIPGVGLAQDDHAADPEHRGHVHDEALDALVVTFSGHERRRFDVVQGTSVLEEDDLQRDLRSTLGDTLARQTGVTSSGFAPGASRPVIRGLEGPRLRVLQNGVSVVDASTTSPDHQVAADPLLAQRIEVLRGAGTLRYGSSAVGGVVNVIDGRIAQRLPEAPLEGAVSAHYGSNADDRNAAGLLRGNHGRFVFHADGFVRRTHDLEVEGDALSNAARGQAAPDDRLLGARGVVPDTDVESHGGTLGTSWVGEDGYVGVAYGRLESDYGVPIPEAARIRIDLKQNRVDVGAGVRGGFGPFEAIEFRGVYGDYQHTELADGERATVFLNRGFEARIEATQGGQGALDGSVGLQWRFEDRDAIGEEAFLPGHETSQLALFAVEELHLDAVTLEGGLRFERTDIESTRAGPDRGFSTWSASVGSSYAFGNDALLGLSLSRTERPPTGEELLSNGPHFATGGFEVGNARLDPEVAWSAEVTFKRREGRVTGGINLYATRFEDFIFQAETGAVVDGLPERRYRQTDADFYGAEVDLATRLIESAAGTLSLDLGFDWVRARADGRNLPRIPAERLRLGLDLRRARSDLRLEGVWVGGQRDTAPAERATDDHFVINASATVRPFEDRDVAVFLQVNNLTDQGGRNHASFLKDRLPIAGRDLRLGLRLVF